MVIGVGTTMRSWLIGRMVSSSSSSNIINLLTHRLLPTTTTTGMIQLRHGVLDKHDWLMMGAKGVVVVDSEKAEERDMAQKKQIEMDKGVQKLTITLGGR